jgi:outer membrane protein assembly factor BamB
MNRTVAALVYIIIVSAVLPPCVSADWSMFRSDSAHSGVGSDNSAGNPVLAPTQLWKTNISWTPTDMEALFRTRDLTETVVVGGVVYVSARSWVAFDMYYNQRGWIDVYAFNATNGAEIWDYRDNSLDQISSLAFANGLVYFGADNNNVYALNAATGTLFWNTSITNIGHSSPAVVDGVVYIGGIGIIYALAAADGHIIWEAHVDANVAWSSPAVSNGVVYVGSFDGMYAFNAITGDKIWNSYGGEDFHFAPTVSKGVIYAITSGENIYAFDAANGARIWNYSVYDGVTGGDAYFAKGSDMIYARSGWDKLYALNALSGAKIWNVTFGQEISPPTLVNNVIYLGSNNSFYALNAHTGEILWNYTIGGGFGSPVVVNGIAYSSNSYGGENNQVCAISVPLGPSSSEMSPPAPFPYATIVIASVVVFLFAVVSAGLLVYHKKHMNK